MRAVLVVEDASAIAELVAIGLRHAGCTLAADAGAAQAAVGRTRPGRVPLPATRRVTRQVAQAWREVTPGSTEVGLQFAFMTHPEHVHGCSLRLDPVWGDPVFIEKHAAVVHFRRLREALAFVHRAGRGETVRGADCRPRPPLGACAA